MEKIEIIKSDDPNFIAHSIVATQNPYLLFNTSIYKNWNDVKNFEITPLGDTENANNGLKNKEQYKEYVKQICKDYKNTYCMMLNFGTCIFIDISILSNFKISFTGFCNDNSPYKIPYTRFENKEKGVKRQLLLAQKYLDEYKEKHKNFENIINVGFEILSVIGYPPVGIDDSDGNVINLWKDNDKNIMFAKVELNYFNNFNNINNDLINLFLLFDKQEKINDKLYCNICDCARNNMRYDIMFPQIYDIFLL